MSIPVYARRKIVDSISFNQLVLPGHNLRFQNYLLKGGQDVIAGSVLGRISASGLLTLCKAAAGDGSEVPMAVVLDQISAFAADGITPRDTPFAAAVGGSFNWTALYFDPSIVDIETARDALRKTGIFTRAPGYSG
jgi:hypothetical protein